jgi:Flp pilus assembly protein TadG
MWRKLATLGRDVTGAVAPTVALSMVALIAAGGIAFDYARLASMDTELQDAADQAALAAATQLDGEANAIARAEAAGQTLITNQTRFANDHGGIAVGGLNFTFYDGYNSLTDTPGNVTTDDAAAKVVQVTVDGRTAYYALTPIVGALSSGAITAEAFAGLQTAVCKVPPLMICNPNPGGDPGFTGNYTGKGFQLVARANNTDPYGPGNFGFLDTGYDTSGGAATLRRALGQSNFQQNCLAGDSVVTEPGATSPALDAINTRFDIYDNNTQQNTICGQGQCPPSANVRKDLMRDAPNNSGGGGTIRNFCKPSNEDTGQKGWKLMPDVTKRYLPPSNAALTATQRSNLYPMGHPRDICHAVSTTGVCSGGRIGDGNWDRAAYFQSNYGSATIPAALGANPTRYQTYLWELNNQQNANPSGINKGFNVPNVTGGGFAGTLQNSPICQTTGVVTPNGDIDRRRLTVAVVNCTGANAAAGKKTLKPVKWVDIFLVEPSWTRDRTTSNDLYVEMIGESKISGPGGQTFQVERSVPYLIR